MIAACSVCGCVCACGVVASYKFTISNRKCLLCLQFSAVCVHLNGPPHRIFLFNSTFHIIRLYVEVCVCVFARFVTLIYFYWQLKRTDLLYYYYYYGDYSEVEHMKSSVISLL